MKSIFTDKSSKPETKDLKKALGKTFEIWEKLEKFTKELEPAAKSEWNFSGEKFGWSYRIKDKKRVLIYLLPRDQFFKIAFVFGPKATDRIMESDVNELIKSELMAAKQYAEGRGIRIDIKEHPDLVSIETLIRIKVKG
jgi:hypothetical protein